MDMNDDKDPLINYARANQPKTVKKRTKKNKKPEKDLQNKEILPWLKRKGFDVTIVEAKSLFNPTLGRYVSSPAVPGFPDLVGNDIDGRAVFIELKAPGRRNSIRTMQYNFLLKKIKCSCFAVCVDSVDMLEKFYTEWRSFRLEEERVIYLGKCLPKIG